MTRASSTNGVRFELFVRGCSASEARVNSVIRQIDSLARAGTIEGSTVRSWPGRVSLLRDRGSTDAVRTYERFQAWASEHDARIEPPFISRELRSSITGERDVVLYTPVVCLAAYEGDDLVDVVPRTDRNRTITIEEFLRRFERDVDDDAPTRPSDEVDLIV